MRRMRRVYRRSSGCRPPMLICHHTPRHPFAAYLGLARCVLWGCVYVIAIDLCQFHRGLCAVVLLFCCHSISSLTHPASASADRACDGQGNAVRRKRRSRGCARNCKRLALSADATDSLFGLLGRLEKSVRAVSQETCRHKSPIRRAGRAVERTTVAATDVQPRGSHVRQCHSTVSFLDTSY